MSQFTRQSLLETVLGVTAGLFLIISHDSVVAQQGPPANDPVKMHTTYSGRIYFSFPRYDFYASGARQSMEGAILNFGAGSSLIYKNSSGLRWNGTGYFDHPAYHNELVTRHQWSRRTLADLVPPTSPAPRQNLGSLSNWPGARRSATEREPMKTTIDFLAQPWVVLRPATSDGTTPDKPMPPVEPPSGSTQDKIETGYKPYSLEPVIPTP